MDATRSDDHGGACTAELVRELGLLRARNAELAAELEKAALDREFLRTELEKTKHQLAKLLRQQYGKKAETVDLPLFAHLVSTEAAKSEAVSEKEEKELRTWIAGHHRTRRKRGERYENLPEKVRQVELTEDQRKCSCCGEQKMRIGEERHTRLEYKPAEVWRETTVQGLACLARHAGASTPAPSARRRAWRRRRSRLPRCPAAWRAPASCRRWW